MTEIEVTAATLAVAGQQDRFPVRRIYCIGKNYVEHVIEMGGQPERDPPFYFCKSSHALVPGGGVVNYPPQTENLHHEIELVVAIGRGGRDISADSAHKHIYAYAVGIDLTRRDLQLAAKRQGRPWDAAKNFDQSAPISELHTREQVGHIKSGRIWLSVNGEKRQEGDLSDMIWNVEESIAAVSAYAELCPGDLIFTGTPAGVGAISPGDIVTGGIDGIGEISIEIV